MIVKIALGVFVGIIVLLALTHIDATASIVKELIARVQDLGGLAPLAYIGLYVVFIVCFMPAEFMHLVAGFIFSRIYGESLGIVMAFFCSLGGAVLSGLCCFMISRHLLYDSLHSWMGASTLFRAFDSAVEEGGLTFVALIRLSPILPYSLTSYLFGVTALKTSHLVLGTFSGTPRRQGRWASHGQKPNDQALASVACCVSPHVWRAAVILAFNFIGSALSDLEDLDIRGFSWTWQRLSLVALGVMMAGVSTAYITILTRRKLDAAYAAAIRERSQRSQRLLANDPGSFA
ncbi:hypothetical protein cyc_06351 [Cyclospora cayetanensis]|uniref:VTT domain-containing protein n=1 Tax=Cyclospora cayetanensis TaxID=88456 RepID=A0A1D3DAN4_9EIME|nr:hypothetical protein cyc_06351 [Cyclospora cayetanensis]